MWLRIFALVFGRIPPSPHGGPRPSVRPGSNSPYPPASSCSPSSPPVKPAGARRGARLRSSRAPACRFGTAVAEDAAQTLRRGTAVQQYKIAIGLFSGPALCPPLEQMWPDAKDWGEGARVLSHSDRLRPSSVRPTKPDPRARTQVNSFSE